MNWNIFKRLENLETQVALLTQEVERYAKQEKHFPKPEKISTEKEIELKKTKQREYYWRNREKLLASRNNEEYKARQREYSRRSKEKRLNQS